MRAGLSGKSWPATFAAIKTPPSLGKTAQISRHFFGCVDASTKDAWELVGGGLTACAESNYVNLYSLLRSCVYKRLGLRCLYGTEPLVHHQVCDPVSGGRVLPAMSGVSLVCCGEM